MPIEPQARAPLTRRDKQLIGTLGAALLAAALALGITLATHSSHQQADCVEVTLPSTMGGATIRRCGANARAFCRQQESIPVVAAACQKHGYGHRVRARLSAAPSTDAR